MSVAFVDSTDGVGLPRIGIGQQNQTATAAAGGTFQFAEISMRTRSSAAQLSQQLGFEVRGDSMFQTFGLVVNLPPLHAEEFGEHALDQVMAEGEFAGNLSTGRSQSHLTVALHTNQPFFL